MRLKSVKTLWNLGGSELTQHALSKEKKCAQCGKPFLCTGEHVYKREDNGTKWYCSYTCWRVKQREDEARAREKFEQECLAYERKAERDRAYMAAHMAEKRASNGKKRKACKDECVKVRTLDDALIRLEEAYKKIDHYTFLWLNAEPATNERYQYRRYITRWERKLAYLRDKVAEFERIEQEAEQNVRTKQKAAE